MPAAVPPAIPPICRSPGDDIWHYIYGFLHAPDYREKYRADLSKDLPRIPFAPDFGAFRDAGEQLAALHLGYETCPEYALQVEVGPGSNPYQLDYKAMQWGGTRKEPDRSVLQVTPAVTLRGIPTEAHGYVVNGRTPLEWAVDRLHIRKDKDSGIVNDANAWFADDPAELVAHLKRPGACERGDDSHCGRAAAGIGGLKTGRLALPASLPARFSHPPTPPAHPAAHMSKCTYEHLCTALLPILCFPPGCRE